MSQVAILSDLPFAKIKWNKIFINNKNKFNNTPQLSLLLLFRFVAFHYDMTTWNLLRRSFSLKGLVQSRKKSQRKNKLLQCYRAKRIKRQLWGKYYKMFASNNDRSKWPARQEFDWSSPWSGRTLSVDRLLFWALWEVTALRWDDWIN